IDQELIKTDLQGAPFLPFFLYRRAALELEADDLEKAQSDVRRAIGLLHDSLGKDALSFHLGECYLTQGRILQEEQKPEAARTAFHLAANNFEKAFGPNHPKTRAAHRLAGL